MDIGDGRVRRGRTGLSWTEPRTRLGHPASIPIHEVKPPLTG